MPNRNHSRSSPLVQRTRLRLRPPLHLAHQRAPGPALPLLPVHLSREQLHRTLKYPRLALVLQLLVLCLGSSPRLIKVTCREYLDDSNRTSHSHPLCIFLSYVYLLSSYLCRAPNDKPKYHQCPYRLIIFLRISLLLGMIPIYILYITTLVNMENSLTRTSASCLRVSSMSVPTTHAEIVWIHAYRY